MVDEYFPPFLVSPAFSAVQIPLWSMNTGSKPKPAPNEGRVQIPLWSMNTFNCLVMSQAIVMFRFLYGRWIRYGFPIAKYYLFCSDSSMVDEYPAKRGPLSKIMEVQIPLWSMNTENG